MCVYETEKCKKACFSEQCVQKCTVRCISCLPLKTFNKDPAETGGGRTGMVVVYGIFCFLDENGATLL